MKKYFLNCVEDLKEVSCLREFYWEGIGFFIHKSVESKKSYNVSHIKTGTALFIPNFYKEVYESKEDFFSRLEASSTNLLNKKGLDNLIEQLSKLSVINEKLN